MARLVVDARIRQLEKLGQRAAGASLRCLLEGAALVAGVVDDGEATVVPVGVGVAVHLPGSLTAGEMHRTSESGSAAVLVPALRAAEEVVHGPARSRL